MVEKGCYGWGREGGKWATRGRALQIGRERRKKWEGRREKGW